MKGSEIPFVDRSYHCLKVALFLHSLDLCLTSFSSHNPRSLLFYQYCWNSLKDVRVDPWTRGGYQWRRLQFFERELVQDEATKKPLRLFESFNVTCSTSGRGALIFGDDTGNVRSFARNMQYHEFQAHDAAVVDVFQLRHSDHLITLGFDTSVANTSGNDRGAIGDASVKIWRPISDSSRNQTDTSSSSAPSNTNSTATTSTAAATNPPTSTSLGPSHSLVKSFRLFAENVAPQLSASRPTCVAMREDFSQIIVGFSCGAVIVLDSPNLIRDRSFQTLLPIPSAPLPFLGPGAVRDPNAGVTKLLFIDTSGMTTCFVVTGCSVSALIASRRRNYVKVIDSHTGAPPGCAVLANSPSAESSTSGSAGSNAGHGFANARQLAIGTSGSEAGVFFYDTEDRSVCFGLTEAKRFILSFGTYLLVVGPEDTTIPMNLQRDVLTVYDLRNRLIAYSGRLDTTVRRVVSEWNSIHVITSRNHMIRLTEMDFQSKMDMLFKKSLYSVAISLAQSQSQSQSGDSRDVDQSFMAGLRRGYGDHLYAKGDLEGAMEQYIIVADSIDASDVIRKYLDPLHTESLAQFLEAYHAVGRALPEHSTLLLNSYTRMGHTEKINHFVAQVMLVGHGSVFAAALKRAQMEISTAATSAAEMDSSFGTPSAAAAAAAAASELMRNVSNFGSLLSREGREARDKEKDAKSVKDSKDLSLKGSKVTDNKGMLDMSYASVDGRSIVRVLHQSAHHEHALLVAAAFNLHDFYVAGLIELQRRVDVVRYICSLPRAIAASHLISSGAFLIPSQSHGQQSSTDSTKKSRSMSKLGRDSADSQSVLDEAEAESDDMTLSMILKLCVALCSQIRYVPGLFNPWSDANIPGSISYQVISAMKKTPSFIALEQRLRDTHKLSDMESLSERLLSISEYGSANLSANDSSSLSLPTTTSMPSISAPSGVSASSVNAMKKANASVSLGLSFDEALMAEPVKTQPSSSFNSVSASTDMNAQSGGVGSDPPVAPLTLSRLFLNHPFHLQLLLEKVIMNATPSPNSSNPSVIVSSSTVSALLELYLRDSGTSVSGEQDDITSSNRVIDINSLSNNSGTNPSISASPSRTEAHTQKIMNLLTSQLKSNTLDVNHAIFLCDSFNFEAGVVLIYSHLGQYSELLHTYIRKGESKKVLQVCSLYGQIDASLWPTALRYYVNLSRKRACEDELKLILSEINKLQEHQHRHIPQTTGSANSASSSHVTPATAGYSGADTYAQILTPSLILEILSGKSGLSSFSRPSGSNDEKTMADTNKSGIVARALARRSRNFPSKSTAGNGSDNSATVLPPNLPLRVIKDFLLNVLQSESSVTLEASEEVARLDTETRDLKAQLSRLQAEPVVFKDMDCKTCGNSFSSTTGSSGVVHFLCGHSFHLQCASNGPRMTSHLSIDRQNSSFYRSEFAGDDIFDSGAASYGNFDESNSQSGLHCPLCTPEIENLRSLRNTLRRSVDEHDEYFKALLQSGGGPYETTDYFTTIADYYGRGAFDGAKK